MSVLKISGIVKNSVVDGPGIRYAIFTQGCYHNCDSCQNPQTHDPNQGKLVNIDDLYNEIINSTIYSGITFSGGEPFLQPDSLADLAIKIKNTPNNNLDIICYTGFTYEEIQKLISKGTQSYARLLNNIDYLIDGRFDKNKVSLDCNWRGSTNQRIIDIAKTRQQNKIIEVEL